MTMKRTRVVLAVGLLGVFYLSQIGASQQASAIPPAPGAPAGPAAGGGGRGGGGQGGRGGGQPAAPTSPLLVNYKSVTAERLKKPEDSDWLNVRRTYDGWGYSPLQEIKRNNVEKLQLKWVALTGQNNGHEAPPMINNGVMFVSTPVNQPQGANGNQVMALDAKTGIVLWRYTRALATQGARVLHPTSRGLGLFGDKVFLAAGDAYLVAIDAKTGRELWSKQVADSAAGYYFSLAPLVADGKVMVGASGGETGIRGFIAAFDPEDGKELWRSFMVPAPGEPGSETWPATDVWKNGGGSIWVTGNYDPETNLAYWGTGNGGPWMGDQRPGDNLYTASTVAIDVASGKIKGHFQYNPNESWDWDEVSPPLLIDYRRNGRTIKGLVNVARNGYLYFLERGSDSKIGFIEGMPYVKQNVFKSLDPKTGRPDVDPEHKPGTGQPKNYCPGLSGGKNWPPIAFSPETRMIYIPANENLCTTLSGAPNPNPARGASIGPMTTAIVTSAAHFGEVQAWNVDTGKKVWTHTFANSANWGPMLATAGDLVFSGGTNDRLFRAYDARNGKVLWEFPTNSGILSQPTSFSIDGKQYIAVMSGFGIDARGMQGTITRGLPAGTVPVVPDGGSIWVFGLNEK
jgi:alcohol dehydrogenase (cytochrome c)